MKEADKEATKQEGLNKMNSITAIEINTTKPTTLNLADHEDERADVVLMQEPWVGIPPDRRMAVKMHPNYNVFSPVDSWNSDTRRPRSLIYVRKHLKADQLRPYKPLLLCPLSEKNAPA
ncbi:hypothetical protein F4819DRAFT_503574 [Hypoxylon fuscum]|nr:hypothetical protein F4819DRAFT_503574 [Hypoxylon fuscum]